MQSSLVDNVSGIASESNADRPICVAFHMIGGATWLGGRNYLLNLLRIVDANCQGSIDSKLFVPSSTHEKDLDSFLKLKRCTIIRSAAFEASAKVSATATIAGRAGRIENRFLSHGVDVAFEHARYWGHRFSIPTIAWLPDFQHRHLRHHFNFFQYWKREIGFRLQTHTRQIMVSSTDARNDCERFYPQCRGRVTAVPFAVPYRGPLTREEIEEVIAKYELPDRYLYLPNQFYAHKNHLLVAKALRILKDEGTEFVVIATGNTRDPRGAQAYDALKRYCDSHSLQSTFRCIGVVPFTDVRRILNASSGLLNPSLFEGWSTTVEEAKADGIPMLLSDLHVHKEQNPGARFFDRNSADSLAERLREHFSAERVQQTPDELQAAADKRLTKFSDQFVSMVRQLHMSARAAT